MTSKIIEGDCLEVMPTMDANSIDAIVCDPPYGLSFMGKKWDHGVPGVPFWTEALRVAKPGAYLLAFGGTRTFHRLTVAIEDAGWEIRDCLMWLYGTGFPKSRNISKDFDKGLREVVGEIRAPGAQQWEGWGTALKPSWEPIIMARKPFNQTVAANVQEHGTGAINIDACRNLFGRWPANVVLDEEAGALLGEQSGKLGNAHRPNRDREKPVTGSDGSRTYGAGIGVKLGATYPVTGGASRFFYCAKASKAEREAGLEGMAKKVGGGLVATQHGQLKDLRLGDDYQRPIPEMANHHPTVKPISLMCWLCKLVTPPNGVILDPFTGSGSTGCAAMQEGFSFIGIEKETQYAKLAEERIKHWVL